MSNENQSNSEKYKILIEPIEGETFYLAEVSIPNVILENGEYRLLLISENEKNLLFLNEIMINVLK